MRILTKKFYLYAGQNYWGPTDRYRLRIAIGIGYREDAPLGEIPWLQWWEWTPDPPRLVWHGRRIVGYSAFGWTRIFRE